MHAGYAVFEKEVSGMDHKMIAAHYALLFSYLSAEAARNANSNCSLKLKHVGETTLSARAATLERRFLHKGAGLVQRATHTRKPPKMFMAGPTFLHGSRKGEPLGYKPPVFSAKPMSPYSYKIIVKVL